MTMINPGTGDLLDHTHLDIQGGHINRNRVSHRRLCVPSLKLTSQMIFEEMSGN